MSFVPSLASAQHIVVTLRSSKTDSFRLGQSLITARTASQICVVTAMQHYFQLVAPSSGPSFLFPVRQAPYQVSGHFPPTGFHSLKGHTFRVGAASTTAAVGLPDWLIKIMDRWSSDWYQLYIRTPRELLLSAAPRMANVTL